MKIIKNFTSPLTLTELNGEVSGLGAELIDVVANGLESVELYFSRYDGAADCLRLTAQRGLHGAPVLCVEYLPDKNEEAADSPAEGPENAESTDAEDDAPQLVARWNQSDGCYFLEDPIKQTVVDHGPFSGEEVADLGIAILDGPAASEDEENEE